jgi:hypothetical protein
MAACRLLALEDPMKPTHLCAAGAALLALGCALVPAQAAGVVVVNWISPAEYADIGRGAMDRERVLQNLGEQLRQLGRRLPDGQTLTLDVTDLDLAGELEPRGPNELRVLRGRADWPRMSLRFTLQAGDTPLRSGQVQLSDMSYLPDFRQRNVGYEVRMVERWFRDEFEPH